MPKIRYRRRFRKAPYTYSKSCLACYSSVTSRCIEIIHERESKLVKHAPCEGTKTVTKYDESREELGDVKVKDLKAPENADGSQSSRSNQRVGQVSLATGTFVNDSVAPSSVTTGVTYKQHEVLHVTCTFHCGDDNAVVPELLTEGDDATVPSVNKPSVATTSKEKETNQSEACCFNCCNECHKNSTVGISYFSDVVMCEECVANIEQACSQCQLAYRTMKLVGKPKSSSYVN